MKRAEKNERSRNKIIDAAFVEFSEKSYAEASLNLICQKGEISKGLIYHYFKDKEDLYLFCVREAFDKLAAYLSKAVTLDEGRLEKALEAYFAARMDFFKMNPLYLKLFYRAVVTPPPHLLEEVKDARKIFDVLNSRILTQLLKKARLRKGFDIDQVIEALRAYQDFMNTRILLHSGPNFNFDAYEKNTRRFLDILLYGVIDRQEEG